MESNIGKENTNRTQICGAETKIRGSINILITDQNSNNFQKKHFIKDMFYPEKRLVELGRENNFEVISLAEDMQKYATKSKKFFYGFKNTILGDGHMNEDGHYISSELLSNAICNIYNSK